VGILYIAVSLFFSLISPAHSAVIYVSPGGLAIPPYTNWVDAATNIQSAVNMSSPGDLILVTNGTYSAGTTVTPGYLLACRVVVTNSITIQSINGPDFTIIQGVGPVGSNAVRCAYLGASGALLSGFTLAGGNTMDSGDLYYDQRGGGILMTPGSIMSNCVVVACSAYTYAGGVYCYGGGTILSSVIASNTAINSAGAHSSGGLIRNSLIHGNTAGSSGCGLYLLSTSVVENCVISNNIAGSANGGGIYVWDYSVVSNSIVTGNMATNSTGVGALIISEAGIFG